MAKPKDRNIIALVESDEVIILDHRRLCEAGKVTP